MQRILHIINKSSLRCHSPAQLNLLTIGEDAIILIEDGVYNAVDTITNRAMQGVIKSKVYVLQADLLARGFESQDLLDHCTLLDYQGFVRLTLEYDIVSNW